MKKILSWNIISNGPWGQAFVIGAVLYENGEETKRFLARCPIEEEKSDWVDQKVLPIIRGIHQTHSSYQEMLKAFAKFYMDNRANSDVIHMGLPVASKIVFDMHTFKYIDEWASLYPWLDISSCLKLAEVDSVEEYNENHALVVKYPEIGGTCNPIYDCRANALFYMDMMKKF